MDIAYQSGSLGSELLLPLLVPPEILLKLCPIGDFTHAYINYGGARMHVITRDQSRLADGGHQDIGAPADTRQIARLGVADGDGGMVVEQQHGHRFTHDIAATNHYR